VNEHPRFKDFADAEEMGGLEGDKVKIDSVLNKEILITDYQIRTSHFKEDSYIIIQFHDEGGLKVIFTTAVVIKKQIEKHKDQIPFYGTIIKKNKYYTLS
jgi:hypothetical protein